MPLYAKSLSEPQHLYILGYTYACQAKSIHIGFADGRSNSFPPPEGRSPPPNEADIYRFQRPRSHQLMSYCRLFPNQLSVGRTPGYPSPHQSRSPKTRPRPPGACSCPSHRYMCIYMYIYELILSDISVYSPFSLSLSGPPPSPLPRPRSCGLACLPLALPHAPP